MELTELEEIIYGDDITGSLRLDIFGPEGDHYRSYSFARRVRRPREGKITIWRAAYTARGAFTSGLKIETRVTNEAGHCVFHSKGNEVIYPKGSTFEGFWENLPRVGRKHGAKGGSADEGR